LFWCRSQPWSATDVHRREVLLGSVESLGMVPLKPWLERARPVSLVWLTLGSAAIAELTLQAAPDAVVIDLQHGLWERRELESAVGTLRAHLPVIVRTQDHSPAAASTALDSGACAALAPLVETPEQAREFVAACRYPPAGRRSGGGLRPLKGGIQGMLALDTATSVGVMIETVLGVTNAEAICAVPGLDFVFIGTGDLALSLGPDAGDAAVREACRRVLDAAHARSLPCGIFTGDADAACRAMDEGYALVVAATDLGIVQLGMQAASRTCRAHEPLTTTSSH
jgi:2-dehydro-3-deoxyglucarate aldolase/4-hydroxy-2-oxoheptanedioate aldolase